MDDKEEFSFEDWLSEIEAIQAEMRAQHGPYFRVDVQALLDEVREERLKAYPKKRIAVQQWTKPEAR